MRREIDRAKEVYMEEICDEIMDLQRKGRYDLMYQKAQQLGRYELPKHKNFWNRRQPRSHNY